MLVYSLIKLLYSNPFTPRDSFLRSPGKLQVSYIPFIFTGHTLPSIHLNVSGGHPQLRQMLLFVTERKEQDTGAGKSLKCKMLSGG